MMARHPGILTSLWILLAVSLTSCSNDVALNNPHTDFPADANIFYTVFTESPKTLDPASSYSSNEVQFTAQIYEPILQYDFFKRPYTLTPLTAASMPVVSFYNAKGEVISENSHDVATTVYDITLRPGIYYQPHPAFAQTQAGLYRYHHITADDVEDVDTLQDFQYTNTRELTAHDYAYQIKRLANPHVQSPIYGVMSEHIVGLKQLNETLQAHIAKQQQTDLQHAEFIDLRQYPLDGVEVIDDYHYRIKINGKYAQFIYWLAMPFFAPMPWEADKFYQQPILQDKNITLEWYPIGTGPYQLSENNPNARMVLSRNPNFRGEVAHTQGGKTIVHPLIDQFVFNLEKEAIPQWTKFLQGYYDVSGISADSFDQAIQIGPDGQPSLTEELKQRGIQLYTTIQPTIYYMGFNMLDNVVGGNSERARKLRQAINLAIDYDEYISIFLNGRGIPANGPIPPGIYGYNDKPNQTTYQQRLQLAKQFMSEAGYHSGIDPRTKRPLILNYDVTATAGPGEKAVLNWMRKQYAKLGIQLHINATQYNRFQEKLRTGNAQIYSWGWAADYPDPENFLFLFYGPNAKVKFGGENASNYVNPTFDKLFEKMRDMPNSDERLQLIHDMVALLQHDMPWIWGFHPKMFELTQAWVAPFTPNAFANNNLKYLQIDPIQRQTLWQAWNKPLRWPALVIIIVVVGFFIPVIVHYIKRGRRPAIKRVEDPNSC